MDIYKLLKENIDAREVARKYLGNPIHDKRKSNMV